MLWLERGDRMPTVAWLQNVLNQDSQSEQKLMVDGDYGVATCNAVKAFQKRRGLPVDGVTGPSTIKEVLNLTSDRIVDFVDDSDAERSGDSAGQHAVKCLVKLGCDILPSIANQDGREIILSGLARRKVVGKLALLRIFAHGSVARQNLTTAKGGYYGTEGGRLNFANGTIVGGRKVPIRWGTRGGMELFGDNSPIYGNRSNMDEVIQFMAQLSKYFAPLGSLELHGCRTASGGKGESFIMRLALAGSFPVTGAKPKNYTCLDNARITLRLEPPTYTAFPLAVDLKTWAQTKNRNSALAIP